uniref:NADH dehydrogenase subunit 2 n=1 Tax=Allacta robusta TaxID=3037031 RepID=UPI0027A48C1F|nr:NADH dehydrogenase subunit 2 [Allacta robusta]WGO57002.1 NADH dehydrogenase subunit 2 [Allacta robusta]
MFNNSTKILFYFTLIGGILLTISSNSWAGAWMGLEINLLSFIPIMTNAENIYTTEASMKYFLVQALASSTLLFMVLATTFIEKSLMIIKSIRIDLMIMIPLLMKSGASPFHWWFPSVMEGLSWTNCLILMTLQKLAPMILIVNIMQAKMWLLISIIYSIMIGSIGGLNQISTRKMLTYSSINHMGWLLSAMLIGENMMIMYFFIYSVMTFTIISIIKMNKISFINQMFYTNYNPMYKFLLFSSLLSLGGLPPFSGFFNKWIIIQFMINNNLLIMNTLMIILSLITLHYYLRITYSAFLILYSETSWKMKNYYQNNKPIMMTIMLMISTVGLLLVSIPLTTLL